jgi:methylthioribose-1-phosphate isomerase
MLFKHTYLKSEKEIIQALSPVYPHERFVEIVDQTLIPGEYRLIKIQNTDDMAEAIRTLRVRGAPAIGIAAAYGMWIGILKVKSTRDVLIQAERTAEKLITTRPTAVNLSWAVRRLLRELQKYKNEPADYLIRFARKIADEIYEDDRKRCLRIADFGNDLISDNCTILTHCHTGGLATSGFGTGLGIIFRAYLHGKKIKVYADETRPLLQGARITTWELQQVGIPVKLITDSMAGSIMSRGKIDAVIVGADRIAANGDVANKIGTYSLAILAKYHDIPFYVAAPESTIDRNFLA